MPSITTLRQGAQIFGLSSLFYSLFMKPILDSREPVQCPSTEFYSLLTFTLHVGSWRL
jgi:hypothetical protein